MKKNTDSILKHSEISEKEIEKYLVRQVKEFGGLCLKYSNPNMTGYPDRIVLLAHHLSFFVEVKSKGKKPTRQQELRHEQLRDLSFPVYVVDSKEQVDDIMQSWKRLINIYLK